MPMHDPELPLITLAEASGRWNGRVSAKCLWRWCRDGILCGGRPVRLLTVRVGGRHMTTVAWVVAFLEEIGDFDARVLEGRSRRSQRLAISARSSLWCSGQTCGTACALPTSTIPRSRPPPGWRGMRVWSSAR